MSLDALENPGDFVGGIAVVVTLVYLAAQIRQNTHQVRIFRAGLADYSMAPGGREWWQRHCAQYPPAFQKSARAEVLNLPDQPPAV